MTEPKQENYGYESAYLESQGGWTIEGGEEAYNQAIKLFNKYSEGKKEGWNEAINNFTVIIGNAQMMETFEDAFDYIEEELKKLKR